MVVARAAVALLAAVGCAAVATATDTPEQLHVSLASDTSVYITWATGIRHGMVTEDDGYDTLATPRQPCVQFAPFSQRLRWRSTMAVTHTYEAVARGQWHGLLHTALVEHLPAGSQWTWRVGDCRGMEWSASHTLRIPRAPQDDGSGRDEDAAVGQFVVMGDQGVGEHGQETARALHAEVQNTDVDAVLHVGDYGYNLADPLKRNWDINEDWYIELKQRSWDVWFTMMQPVLVRTLFMGGGGNHETLPFDLSFVPLKHRLPMPWVTTDGSLPLLEQLAQAGAATTLPGVHLYYSFNAAGVHVVMLDTEGDFTPGSPQLQWLEQDLQQVRRSDIAHIVVLGHRPMFSSAVKQGSNLALREAVQPLLLKYRVSVYFCGHDHSYERTHPLLTLNGDAAAERAAAVDDTDPWRGVVHIRVGTGGMSHLSTWQAPDAPSWTARRDALFGFVRMAVTRGGVLKVEFVRTGVDGGDSSGTELGVADAVAVPPPITPPWAMRLQDDAHDVAPRAMVVDEAVLLPPTGGGYGDVVGDGGADDGAEDSIKIMVDVIAVLGVVVGFVLAALGTCRWCTRYWQRHRPAKLAML